jgi:hypothetical protein|tara:strand:- start:80 stop:910 length:831 start_codon:yes stop_codon:yes gene_type:complete
MRTFSFGAGVQSTAVLVLQAQGRLPEPYDAFLFANVGDDSEHPDTLRYYREIHVPYAEKHGIPLHELRRVKRDGTEETLYGRITKPGTKTQGIPIYLSNGAPGRRSCTADFKIRVIHKWQRQNGSSRENPAVCGLGISMDEIQRARTDSGFPDQTLEYPLLDHKPPLRRVDCYQIIEEAGLPKPPRSACYFCPFHSMEAWRTLKRETPDLFQKAVDLEVTLNMQRADSVKDGVPSVQQSKQVWLTRKLRPLDQVVDDQLVLDLDGPDGCDTGSCFT